MFSDLFIFLAPPFLDCFPLFAPAAASGSTGIVSAEDNFNQLK